MAGPVSGTVLPGSRDAPAVTESCLHRRRFSLPHEVWYAVHLATYAGIALAFAHQLSNGTELAADPPARYYWTTLYVVSGATYTSNGYAQSLQSALDRAHA
jgi:hypothetical protein